MVRKSEMIDKEGPDVADEVGVGAVLLACAIVGLWLFSFWIGTGIGVDVGQAMFGTQG